MRRLKNNRFFIIRTSEFKTVSTIRRKLLLRTVSLPYILLTSYCVVEEFIWPDQWIFPVSIVNIPGSFQSYHNVQCNTWLYIISCDVL